MKTAHEPFHEIIDTYTFSVVTDNIDNCYRALGVIHNLYKPKPARFMDYIAIPKSNGYQSLHTSVIGPHGVQIDVMIRTDYMDRLDDKGVAAEWAYDLKDDPESSIVQSKAKLWVKNLLELQESVGNSFEFIENVKTDLFPDEIYVFTPEEDILAAERRHGGGLRLCRAHRPRQPLRGREGRQDALSSREAPDVRAVGRDHHEEQRGAERRVARLCRHVPRPLQDQAVPEGHQ